MISTIPQIINSLSRGLGSRQSVEDVPPEWDYEDWARQSSLRLQREGHPPEWEWKGTTYVYMNHERDVAIWADEWCAEFCIGPVLVTIYADGSARARIVPMSHEDGQKGITGDGN
jgi:hypothetical protein